MVLNLTVKEDRRRAETYRRRAEEATRRADEHLIIATARRKRFNDSLNDSSSEKAFDKLRCQWAEEDRRRAEEECRRDEEEHQLAEFEQGRDKEFRAEMMRRLEQWARPSQTNDATPDIVSHPAKALCDRNSGEDPHLPQQRKSHWTRQGSAVQLRPGRPSRQRKPI